MNTYCILGFFIFIISIFATILQCRHNDHVRKWRLAVNCPRIHSQNQDSNTNKLASKRIFFLHSSMIEMDHPFSNKLWLAISIPHTQISMETNLLKKGNLDRRSYLLLHTYPTAWLLLDSGYFRQSACTCPCHLHYNPCVTQHMVEFRREPSCYIKFSGDPTTGLANYN